MVESLIAGCTGTEASFYPEIAFLYQERQVDVIRTGRGSPTDEFIQPLGGRQCYKEGKADFVSTELQLRQINHDCQQIRLEQYIAHMDGLLIGFSLNRPRDYDCSDESSIESAADAELRELNKIIDRVRRAQGAVNEELSVVLVGVLPAYDETSKVTCERSVSAKEAQTIASGFNLPYVEFSCDQESLDTTLELLIQQVRMHKFNL